MNKKYRKAKFSTNIIFIIFICGVLNGCQKKEIDCPDETVAFDLELDLSAVLDHETTDSTTHIKIFHENYFNTGNLVDYQQYSFLNSTKFNESICLPIETYPTDSIILAIVLIQNNNHTRKEAAIFLNVPYEKTEVNCVTEEITSHHLWDRPVCAGMPTVFQNIESYGGSKGFDISVAGGFGIGANVLGDPTIEEIKLMGDDSLIDYYESGWCPCSKYYVRFYE